MARLTPQQFDRISRLLKDAVDAAQLERYVYVGTGDRLFVDFVAPGLTLRETVWKLLEALERDGVTDRVLSVVYREKPFQAELREAIAEIFPAIPASLASLPLSFEFQTAGVPNGDRSEGPALQRIVKPKLKAIDASVWLSKFETIRRQVCRVEANEAPLGTGFLVGPGAALTNWHVVNEARKRGLGDKIVCRFGYRRRVDGGVDAGTCVAVAAVADEAPCSDAELNTDHPDVPPPTTDQLDFALLRLAAAEPERGYQRLAEPPPAAAGDPLIIVQHPNGEPIRFAIDTDGVIGSVHGGLRLRYATNTQRGSSGSPCYSMDFDLLALHHLGDPQYQPKYNQGVPIGLVVKRVAGGPGAALLGG